jgi:hypothetical protein
VNGPMRGRHPIRFASRSSPDQAQRKGAAKMKEAVDAFAARLIPTIRDNYFQVIALQARKRGWPLVSLCDAAPPQAPSRTDEALER